MADVLVGVFSVMVVLSICILKFMLIEGGLGDDLDEKQPVKHVNISKTFLAGSLPERAATQTDRSLNLPTSCYPDGGRQREPNTSLVLLDVCKAVARRRS